jgi:hypothetical protein
MKHRNQHRNLESAPRQLAFGQSSRVQLSPEEAAAEHWHEVYRLAKELRQRPKRRGRKAWAPKGIQTRKRQGRQQDAKQNKQQNRQQELLPQQPTLPELQFTKPQAKDLRVMNTQDMSPYRFTDLRLSATARNHHLYDETVNSGDSSQAGRAICRHLIAALRIQHAEEQQQQAQNQQSEIQ